jgi:hypothetical protein
MVCNRKTVFSIALSLICLFDFTGVKAQSVTEEPVALEIRESSVNDQIVSHILKITNRSELPFNGTIVLEPLPEIRPLSQPEREISVAPGDSSFVAFKLVRGRDIAAGRKTVRYCVYDEKKEKVLCRETYIDIEKREQIYLLADDAPVMVINPEDSVRIQVTVNNSGNTREEVTVVFNVPDLLGAPPFTELKETVLPMEQKRVTFSFIPSGNLLSSGQFSVRVTAMKGEEKTIFGNKTVTVQNVSANRSYVDINRVRSLFPGQGSDDNSLTLSYRQYNSSSNMLQLQGGGYLNLPAGYLHLKGDIYKYNSQPTPMVTNTSLTYKLYENEFTVGNVSEQTELPLFGRGVKASFSDEKKSKTLTFGAVDQNFNLLSSEPWFANYYSFYAQGALGANNMDRGVKATYIYQKNPYEKAIYNVAGLQWRTLLGKNWNIQLEAHGSLSNYENVPGNKFSGAAEFKYTGNLSSGLNLDGSGYYSDAYFPGSRKGTVSLTQGISRKLLNDLYIGGSISYNRTAPKSYAYDYTYRSENSYGNLTLSLPKWDRISSSLYYRYQGESSPSYASYLDVETVSGNVRMASHRMGWQWRWQSPNVRHSLFGTLEGGFFADPLESGRSGQAKTTLNYSWQWLTADVSYQRGPYYLYEYMMAKQRDKEFTRFTSSASVNSNISKKVSLNANINFTRDVYQGNVPSANLTANYTPKDDLALFMNAYWYRYQFINTSNVFNVQVGVTWNLSKAQPLSGKKSSVIAKVYYDHNANNCYDNGDEPARDYLLNLDDKAFISDEDGKVRYSLVPYGEYTLKPMKAGQWSFDQKKIKVDGFKTRIEIPLRQSGTLQGSIRYEAGENSVEIVQRTEGFRFTISGNEGKFLQTVVTDANGRFITFLPVGEYTITLDQRTLPEHTECKEPVRNFRMEAGKVNELEPFVIEVKSRKVNVKKFYDEKT